MVKCSSCCEIHLTSGTVWLKQVSKMWLWEGYFIGTFHSVLMDGDSICKVRERTDYLMPFCAFL